jgi:hypothetical protein
MDRLDSYPVPNSSVIGRILDSPNADHLEAVIVLPASGKIEVLNDVGARIWSLVDGRRSVRDIATLLSDEYQVDSALAEVDTLAFLEDLAGRGAISFRETPSP